MRIPRLTGKDLIRAMEQDGFVCVRIHGSHHIMRKHTSSGALVIPVPAHSGKIIKFRTLNGILRKAQISRERLTELL